MSRSSSLVRRLALGVAAAGAALLLLFGGLSPAVAAQRQPAPAASLDGVRVLLTNDDSMQAARPNNSDGLGLYELRRALCNAGADVVVIAPWQVQSGRGSAVSNSGVLHLGTKAAPQGYENDCADAPSGAPVYGLCLDAGPCGPASPSATPSDTVKFATRGGLHAVVGWEEPDLVVSGINSGLNVASSVSDSGTVGAALAAIEHGIPAVAFSTAFDSSFSFPVANYRATAEWGATFLSGLKAKDLLSQAEFGLNVNYPNVSEGTPAKPAVWTSVGTQTYAYHSYVPRDDGSFQIALGVCEGVAACEEDRGDADVTATIHENRISVTPIGWDRTFGYKEGGQKQLAKIRTFVEHDAPRP